MLQTLAVQNKTITKTNKKERNKMKKLKEKTPLIALSVVILLLVMASAGGFMDKYTKYREAVANDPSKSNSDAVVQSKQEPLPTRQNPGCIVLTGTEPVEIPIFVPNSKKFSTWTYDDVNYRCKDKTWDEYVYRSAGIRLVTAEKHIFEPVVALTDVHPDQKARIFYCVE